VSDPEVYAVVAELKRRRARDRSLLAYRNGHWAGLRSTDVNDYLKGAAGDDFTAKDFRTWHATVLAAVAVAVAPEPHSETSRKRTVSAAVADVAEHLGNTPAVCRASYIDPRVFDRYAEGATIATALKSLDEVETAAPALQRRIERAVLALLEDD
jgi:DNA topoisomerase IB